MRKKLTAPIPIIFIHFGYNDYLKVAIHQARSSNPDSEIILLGDAANKSLEKICPHIFFSDYSGGKSKLESKYVHLSYNGVNSEFFWLMRWFVLLEFMKVRKMEWVCYLDSDVMLYASVQSYFQEFICNTKYEAAYCIPSQEYDELRWVSSGHTSFLSIAFLEKFCNYILDSYENKLGLLNIKYNNHRKFNLPGGVGDMTFFYLYHNSNRHNILNLLIPNEIKVFDSNVNSGNNLYHKEFKKNGAYKAILFQRDHPYAFDDKHKKVFFQSLHFQGVAKNDMIKYYRGNLRSDIIKIRLYNFYHKTKEKLRSAL